MPTPSGRPSMMDAILAGEKIRMTIQDADICFKNPVKSMIDGSVHYNRKQYNTHLKDHGCIEIGNEAPKERTEVRGDFDIKKDLVASTKKVLSKS